MAIFNVQNLQLKQAIVTSYVKCYFNQTAFCVLNLKIFSD